MITSELTQLIFSVLFVSLRIAPTFAFAPPFTLMRIPVAMRVLLSVSLAGLLVSVTPLEFSVHDLDAAGLLSLVLGELLIGIGLGLTLQLVFAAMLVAGRAIDIQAGFGLAVIVDPTTGGQMPLIGTIFAYGAAAVFFTIGGPADLLAIWGRSLTLLPVGTALIYPDIPALFNFISAAFFIAIGLSGIVLLTLFLIDLSVAFISRTLPQMNVLLVGFQVKTLAVLITVPIAIAVSSSAFLRLIRLALETSLQLF